MANPSSDPTAPTRPPVRLPRHVHVRSVEPYLLRTLKAPAPARSVLIRSVLVWSVLVWSVLLSIALAHPGAARASVAGVTVETTGEQGLSFVVDTHLARVETAADGGLLIEDAWHGALSVAADLGLPRVPLTIATPSGSGVRFDVEVLRTTPLSLTAMQSARLSQVIPPEGLDIGSPSYWREQHCVASGWIPLVREAGAWRYVARARFVVRFESGDADDPPGGRAPGGSILQREDSPAPQASRVAGAADPWEGLYRDVLLNYEEGRRWRRPRAELRARAAAGSAYFSSTDQPWIRVATDHEGVYEIRGSDLQALGLDLRDVDPLSLRLFAAVQLPLPTDASVDQVPGWMDERPITVEGGADGTFDGGDRILFLGSGPDGWYTTKGTSPPGLEAWAFDPYANEDIAWLTWGGSFPGAPARHQTVDASDVIAPYIDRVRDRAHLETNGLFDARPRDGNARWERYWTRRVTGTSDSVKVETLPSMALPGALASELVEVTARFWGANDLDSDLDPPPPDHDLEFLLDGNPLFRRQWEGVRRQDFEGSGLWLDPARANDHRFVMRIHPHVDNTITRLDIILFAFLDVTYGRQLIAQNDRLDFFAGGLSGGQSLELRGFTRDDVRILEVTDPFAPRWLEPERTTVGSDRVLRFRTQIAEGLPSRFLARSSAAYERPDLELDAPPAGGYLRERTEAVQMIVLTAPSLRAQAEELAAFRRTHYPDRDLANVVVLDVRDVYDEFSFGRKDVAAIRNFLQFARDHWTGGDPEDGPAHVLFFGDAHFDYRGLSENAGDLVSTYADYHSTNLGLDFDPRFSSDDFFAILDGPTDELMDMSVGRLVARNAAEARVMVEKIRGYEANQELGSWKNRVTLIADDLCQTFTPDGLGWTHNRQTETLATEIFPPELRRDKIYLVEFGKECVFTQKPGANSLLQQAMAEGTLVVNFTGHGSETQIADERIFDLQGVPSLSNRDRLFLFLTASCSVGKYDRNSLGLGEELIRHEGGGAIVVFSASSVAGSLGNSLVNQAFFSNVFPSGHPGNSRPVGEAAVVAKVFAGGINQRRFILHGDPTTRLVAPRLDAELQLTAESGGTAFTRGALMRLQGTVLTPLSEPPFDGDATVTVFDSQILRRPTPGIDDNDYLLEGAPIFRGTVPVRAGVFETQFLVPAALRTGDRGHAEVRVYFEDGTRDGTAALTEIVVPETAPPPTTDQLGPTITVDFDDDLEAVAPEGRFVVSFADSSGINITGLVPSRSVILRIEDGGDLIAAEDIASLVDFGDDYRTATAEVRLPADLPEGRRYDLVLEASDNVNNRSSARASFFLSSSGSAEFRVEGVYNFPNPTEGATRFFAELAEESEVEIQIFTVSGRRIARLGPMRRTPRELSGAGIAWDGRDADGDVLGNGVYLYKITARAVSSGRNASRIERLVVSR